METRRRHIAGSVTSERLTTSAEDHWAPHSERVDVSSPGQSSQIGCLDGRRSGAGTWCPSRVEGWDSFGCLQEVWLLLLETETMRRTGNQGWERRWQGILEIMCNVHRLVVSSINVCDDLDQTEAQYSASICAINQCRHCTAASLITLVRTAGPIIKISYDNLKINYAFLIIFIHHISRHRYKLECCQLTC